jgi:putative DNA methylase
MPLVRSFALSTKKGMKACVEPVVERSEQMPRIHFSVKTGMGSPPNGTVKRTGANCIACGTPVPFNHIRSEGQAGRMKAELMVIVAEGKNGRLYLPPSVEYEAVATQAKPEWIPDADLTHNPRDFKTPKYGMRTFGDLFTNRQLVALTTLSSLVDEAQKQVLDHARRKAVHSDSLAYANAVATYLSLGVSKLADALTSLVRWKSSMDQAIATFGRQALPMVWDYAESNTFNGAAGDFSTTINNLARVLDNLNSHISGVVRQLNAAEIDYDLSVIISTDPPYYDNIDYADLSDFFYIWLRKSLAKYYPGLFATVLVPKTQELIAAPHRFGGDRQKANDFFENGLRNVFKKMYTSVHMGFPLTVFYAFKQVEVEDGEDDDQPSMRITETRVSTGWETMLEGLLSSNFQITGTWPMRTELSNRTLASEKNALASSIILACRPRSIEAPIINRRDFLSLLKREIPPALRQLQQGNIAPVDLAQAAIGPGMAVFSRYKQVLEGDGSPMGVRTALGIINQALDEFLAEQEGEYDGDTRWALAWYEQYGHDQGPYGVAETLSKAKNTSVEGLVEACILEARAGKVRLLRRDELDPDWDPQKDKRPTAWEACQHLIFGLEKGGEQTAATLLAKLGILSESTRDLAYRLYTICERKNRTQEALYYNMLVIAWPRLKELARSKQEATQGRLI